MRPGPVQLRIRSFCTCCLESFTSTSTSINADEVKKEGNGPSRIYIYLGRGARGPRPVPCELECLFGQDEISARPKRASTPRHPPAPRNSHMHVVHGACRSALHTYCPNVTSTSHHSNNCNCNCNAHTPLPLPFRLIVTLSWSIISGSSTHEPMGPSLL
jgi:hypothetical protein